MFLDSTVTTQLSLLESLQVRIMTLPQLGSHKIIISHALMVGRIPIPNFLKGDANKLQVSSKHGTHFQGNLWLKSGNSKDLIVLNESCYWRFDIKQNRLLHGTSLG